MADKTNIARPYAKAAFEFANEKHELELWSKALRTLSFAVSDSKMQMVLSSPEKSESQLVEILLPFSEGNKAIENFLRLLAENKRLNVLPYISDLFQEAVAETEGYLQLTVTSAFDLNEEQRKSMQANLAKQFNSNVKISYQENSDLIGGVVVRSKQWVLDDSVRGKLARLQSALS